MMSLQSIANKLYHPGIGVVVSLSNLTWANKSDFYLIYEELAMTLIAEAQQLYANDDNLEVNKTNKVFAIDATINHLCLSSFYRAVFRSTKAGIKLYT